MAWQSAAENKKKNVFSCIPKEWLISPSLIPLPTSSQSVLEIPSKLLSTTELEITEHKSVVELARKIADKEYSAVDVVTAYCKRAAIAHQLVNCLCCIFFDEAIKRAQELDLYLEREKRTVGPLHGIPISLKDQFRVKGTETIMGYVSWIGIVDEQDSVLVEILKQQGAVVYCKTNVPQTLMSPETCNNVFGRTLLPHNPQLTCGGSSGGEGALISMGGSLLGVGTDIGGSIRIPAAMNGLFALRPSSLRIPYFGAKNSMDGFESIRSVCGPLAKSPESLTCFGKSVLSAKPWLKDPATVALPWQEGEYAAVKKADKLCFGVMWDDGNVAPIPVIKHYLEIVTEQLVAKGHSIIEWNPPVKHVDGINLAIKLFSADGGEEIAAHINKSGEPYLSSVLAPAKISIADNFTLHIERNNYAKKYMDYWNNTAAFTNTGRPVDAIICPVAAHTAPPHNTYDYCGYTMIWNLLDYTVAVIPVTSRSKVDNAVPNRPSFLGSEDEANHKLYINNANAFVGTPVSLQLVGRRMQEERILSMAEELAPVFNVEN